MALQATISTLRLSAKFNNICPPCPPAEPVNIFNSDNSYTEELLPGTLKELDDSIARNSLNNIVDQKPYSQELSVADSVLSNSDDSFTHNLPATEPYELLDAVAKNSLNETVDTKPYGQELTIADSVIYKANGITTLTTIPAENNKTTTQIIDLMSNAEVFADLDAAQKSYIFEQLPVTSYARPLPTDVGVSYELYDDAWVRTNILNVTPTGKINVLVAGSTTLLVYNNAFGNKLRFTDYLGNAISGAGGYMIDHLYGLGYWRVAQPDADFATACAKYATFSVVVGGQTLTEFFLPDINILSSLKRYDVSHGISWVTSANISLMSSTTSPGSITRCLYTTSGGQVNQLTKTLMMQYILCRKHYSN